MSKEQTEEVKIPQFIFRIEEAPEKEKQDEIAENIKKAFGSKAVVIFGNVEMYSLCSNYIKIF